MSVQPEEWTEEEYCAFYQSTTCTQMTVSSYSCVPTCLSDCSDVFCDSMSALVFGCDATSHATYKNKSALESSCLTSFSTNSPTQTDMTFTSSNEFDNVSPSEMNTTEGKEAAIAAMSLAMSGVTTDQIKIVSITGSEGRRRQLFQTNQWNSNEKSHSSLRSEAISSVVIFKITVALEKLGYSSSSSSAAYDKLINQISTSVSSGQFQQNLKAAGQTLGITTFQSVAITKTPSYSPPAVVYQTTTAPTPLPSPLPTPNPTNPENGKGNGSSNGNGDSEKVGIIVGSVIGGFVFLILIFGLIFFFCLNPQRREEIEATFQRAQFKKVSADDSPRFVATVPSGIAAPAPGPKPTAVMPAPRLENERETNRLL
jgi:hypothetical protein